ncbi:hypothetical protein B11Q_00231 [Corynebacterium diphtheriae]|uniref:hypothetical protein n=1 Tax=Corynebacterium diphtheriae TaxID=1717 RepID=UPI000D74B3E8|nr:hypothetical protein [Corynebacterium diphtheriae]AWR14947.1 hypothetical protein B11Q_00231 [Corynebacterium diphtheriae]
MSKKNFARVSAIALTLPIIATATFIPNSNATDSKEEGGTRRAFAFENPAHTSPVEEENSNLEPNKSGYAIEPEDFDEDEVSYDYSKIKERDWDNSRKINPAYSDGSDFEYNSDNYVFDAYIDGYDDEESELNKMLRKLKQLQQKKMQEQLNYENSAESTTNLVAQPAAELGSEAEAESTTPVAQQTAKPSDNVLAANRYNAIQTSTGTGIEGSVLNNRYKAYLKSKSEAESATPVAQQTAKPSDNVLAANRYNAIQTSTGTGIEGSVLNNRYKAYLKSKSEAESATPVAQQTAKPSDNVLAANRYNAIQTPTGTGIEGSVLNNRYKAYLKSKSEAESTTPVAQPSADTVSHNSSSDTSEN